MTTATDSSNTDQGDRRQTHGKSGKNMQVPSQIMEALYTTMRRIRTFEERTTELFNDGVVKGTAHSYMGEEAIASAVCANLDDEDFIASYHRGHGHCIAKGAKTDRMMAELMGRDTGYCRGLGGSMHIADMELNILGANGIVGAGMPLATGAALASKLRGRTKFLHTHRTDRQLPARELCQCVKPVAS